MACERYSVVIIPVILQFLSLVQARSHYHIIAPHNIRSNSTYSAVVSVYANNKPCEVKVSITGALFVSSKTVNVEPGSVKRVDFTAPELKHGEYTLSAVGTSGLHFDYAIKLQAIDTYNVFVQTDKEIYKPRDLVLYHVLCVDEKTRPLDKIVSIVIKDGASNVSETIKHVNLVNGAYTGEVQLSTGAVFGNWSVQVKIGKADVGHKTFQVLRAFNKTDENGRFTVTIDTPFEVALSDKVLPIRVLAYFENGLPVKGKASVTLQVKGKVDQNELVKLQKVVDIYGAATVQFNTVFELIKAYDALTLYFEIIASVEHTETKDVETATSEVNVHRTHTYEITAIDMPTTFSINETLIFEYLITYQNNMKIAENTTITMTLLDAKSNQTIPAKPISEGNTSKFIFQVEIPQHFTASQAYAKLKIGENISRSDTLEKGLLVSENVDPLKPYNTHFNVSNKDDISDIVYTIVSVDQIVESGYVEVPEQGSFDFKVLQNLTEKDVLEMGIVDTSYLYLHYFVGNKLVFQKRKMFQTRNKQFGNTLNNFISLYHSAIDDDISISFVTQSDSFVGILGSEDVSASANPLDDLNEFMKSVSDVGGLAIMTDAIFNNVPLTNKRKHRQIRKVVDEDKIPKTWFFKSYQNSQMSLGLASTVPDWSKPWLVSAYSLHPKMGFAYSKFPMKVKYPLVTAAWPDSVKSGENVVIPVTLYNNEQENRDIRIYIYDLNNIELLTELSTNYTLPAHGNKTESLNFRVTTSGSIKVTIEAVSDKYQQYLNKISTTTSESGSTTKSPDKENGDKPSPDKPNGSTTESANSKDKSAKSKEKEDKTDRSTTESVTSKEKSATSKEKEDKNKEKEDTTDVSTTKSATSKEKSATSKEKVDKTDRSTTETATSKEKSASSKEKEDKSKEREDKTDGSTAESGSSKEKSATEKEDKTDGSTAESATSKEKEDKSDGSQSTTRKKKKKNEKTKSKKKDGHAIKSPRRNEKSDKTDGSESDSSKEKDDKTEGSTKEKNDKADKSTAKSAKDNIDKTLESAKFMRGLFGSIGGLIGGIFGGKVETLEARPPRPALPPYPSRPPPPPTPKPKPNPHKTITRPPLTLPMPTVHSTLPPKTEGAAPETTTGKEAKDKTDEVPPQTPEQESSSTPANPNNFKHYHVVAPYNIRSNSKYTVQIAVHASVACEVKVSIAGSSFSDSKVVTVGPRSLSKVDFQLPELGPGEHILTAVATSGLQFDHKMPLNVMDPYNVFVQTDKDTYNPGDLVIYHVLSVDEKTRPRDFGKSFSIVLMDNTSNSTVHTKAIKLFNGAYTGEFQLNEEAAVGNWSLKVQIGDTTVEDKIFRVLEIPQETVGPVKFKVVIDVPAEVTVSDQVLQFRVIAYFAHGTPVKGKATITLEMEDTNEENELVSLVEVVDIDGVVTVDFDAIFELIKTFDAPILPFKVIASVEHAATREIENATTRINVHRTHSYKITPIDIPFTYTSSETLTFMYSITYQNNMILDANTSVTLELVDAKNNQTQPATRIPEIDASIFTFQVEIPQCFTASQAYAQLKIGDNISRTDILERGLLLSENVDPLKPYNTHFNVSNKDDISDIVYTIVSVDQIVECGYVEVPEHGNFEFKVLQNLTEKDLLEMGVVDTAFLHIFYFVGNKLVLQKRKMFQTRNKQIGNTLGNFILLYHSVIDNDISISFLTQSDSFVGILASEDVSSSAHALSNLNGFMKSVKENGGLVVMTDGIFNETVLPKRAKQKPKRKAVNESKIPKTWFFKSYQNSKASLGLISTLPDWSKPWLVSAYSLHPTMGFAYSKYPMKVKYPLVIATWPESKTSMDFPVTLYNKEKENRRIRLLIYDVKNMELLSNVSRNEQLEANDIKTELIRFRAGKSGSFNVSIQAISDDYNQYLRKVIVAETSEDTFSSTISPDLETTLIYNRTIDVYETTSTDDTDIPSTTPYEETTESDMKATTTETPPIVTTKPPTVVKDPSFKPTSKVVEMSEAARKRLLDFLLSVTSQKDSKVDG